MRPLRLLLIDDDEVDRMVVKRALKAADVNVASIREVYDFFEAQKVIALPEFDCVFLDVQLPGGDGLDLIRVAREAGADCPVIVLTGHGDEAVAVEAMKRGAGDYMPKHLLRPDRLAQSLRQVLRVHDAEQRAQRAHDELQKHAGSLERLVEASAEIHAAATLEETLQQVARHAQLLFGSRLAMVRLEKTGSEGAIERQMPVVEGPVDPDAPAIDLSAVSPRAARLSAAQLEALPALSSVRERFGPLSSLMAAPIRGPERETIGALLVIDPKSTEASASEQGLMAQLAQTASVAVENAQLYREAQRATRTRDDVLAIVSHDLRTPLNVVALSAALLREQLSEPAALALVARTERGATRMNRLIEDLLDASLIEAGTLAIRPRLVDASVLMSEAVEAAAAVAEARGCKLVAQLEGPSFQLKVDPERVLQLLANVIGNAVKFTPKGSGTIELKFRLQRGRARVEVSDNGAGIPAEHVPHLFKRYWRGTQARRDGAGLGLFIASGIAEAHRGTIQIESQVGAGTCVSIELPLA